ncbi:MAG: pyridoxamine 5'-phosphate oxidase family protein [Armatimonadota bacterium]
MSDTLERAREIMARVHNMHILATVDDDGQPHCRWMGALVEDPASPWTFYLACGKQSRKMSQIAANPKAQLVFSDETKWEVATLSGLAVAEEGAEPRQWLFDAVPMMKKYYSGPDDEKMGVIKFKVKCLEILAMHENREPVCLDLE